MEVLWKGGEGMRQKHRRRRLNTKGKLFFAGVFFLFGILCFQFGLAPVLRDAAENEAKRLATEAINETVSTILSEESEGASSYLVPSYGEDGEVLGLTTDTVSANQLKEEIISGINNTLGIQTREVHIPIGTLFGNEWLYGRGPAVTLKIVLAGNIDAEFRSEFLSAGINQTKYCLYIDIQTSVYTFLPGVRGAVDVESNILAAETVIVGNVPQVFANIDGMASGSENGLPDK